MVLVASEQSGSILTSCLCLMLLYRRDGMSNKIKQNFLIHRTKDRTI